MNKAVEPAWRAEPKPWGSGDLVAIGFWTAALVAFFWDAATFRGALFYFDITEINYAYRDFLAKEIRLWRFSRWFPGLYCGFPLYSESQAGYWHPLKYVLYPWLETWKAFNLDTILSLWLTGLGTYGWLRRRVGPSGALTGAALFGLSGFAWAHLIHTSMTNALISVPLVVWALEYAWDSGKPRGIVLGALALAAQVFAGHLQDTILTAGIVALYGLYRAITEIELKARVIAASHAVSLIGLGVMIAAVQWIPSKELLDRSPRAGGLSWEQVTYGSWSPELLPTLVIREAYGTRARDTDWMDGYYPYHEMNAYLGLIGIGLACLGASARKDRWVAFWVLLAGIGGLLMLGKFTFLFDFWNHIPIVGSSRIPVRFHLWVALATAALAAVGVDRLSRPGAVSFRHACTSVLLLVAVSVPVIIYVYEPIWRDPNRWSTPYHLARYKWLGRELGFATVRTFALLLFAGYLAGAAARSTSTRARSRIAAILPVLVLADLLGSHIADVPTIDPSYWTSPPESARLIKSDRSHIRVFGTSEKSAGEPGYASEPIDFMPVRDALGWSLPPVWGLSSSIGETPIIPKRLLDYTDNALPGRGRFDVESVTHILTSRPTPGLDPKPIAAGATHVHRNMKALPRARLVGRPVYARDQADAARVLRELGGEIRGRVVVEDPTRPLPESAAVSGSARITRDDPESVEVETNSVGPAYLVLADTFDPGWSATIDGAPSNIRPAYSGFRAVYLPAGSHRVSFAYQPARFMLGLSITGIGLAIGIALCLIPARRVALRPTCGEFTKPIPLLAIGICLAVLVIGASALEIRPNGGFSIHPRWTGAFHKFTWGAGIEAIESTRAALGR